MDARLSRENGVFFRKKKGCKVFRKKEKEKKKRREEFFPSLLQALENIVEQLFVLGKVRNDNGSARLQ